MYKIVFYLPLIIFNFFANSIVEAHDNDPCRLDDHFFHDHISLETITHRFTNCMEYYSDGKFQRTMVELDLHSHEHNDSKGSYINFEDHHGAVLFSTHSFTDEDLSKAPKDRGAYFYYRTKKGDDNTFFSTHSFTDEDLSKAPKDRGAYFYYRTKKGDDNTFFSTHSFTDEDLSKAPKDRGAYFYYRTKKGDDNTFLSLHEFESKGKSYLYIRKTKGDKNTFLSVVDGHHFRDRNKNEMSHHEFSEHFDVHFWEPLLEKSLAPLKNLMKVHLPKHDVDNDWDEDQDPTHEDEDKHDDEDKEDNFPKVLSCDHQNWMISRQGTRIGKAPSGNDCKYNISRETNGLVCARDSDPGSFGIFKAEDGKAMSVFMKISSQACNLVISKSSSEGIYCAPAGPNAVSYELLRINDNSKVGGMAFYKGYDDLRFCYEATRTAKNGKTCSVSTYHSSANGKMGQTYEVFQIEDGKKLTNKFYMKFGECLSVLKQMN